ncbi:hypothetical protein FJN17_08115 [Bradyrhizobium symbiodeficiens]|uniref:Uncharacterized protein n=1 Tax=Bradyrhizobium symbiodeficiens TaxID=1404367 RepID=A0ABX5W3H2_9BRAD|nr:hypothetical protein [Bradyrhizobium symbiodeficiens]QDF37534.1 hypothetical protein FJN17_08115 [Bradyrhizobium symbiodeficiens]
MYATLRAKPDLAKIMFNAMALSSFVDDYDRSLIQVARSTIPLRSSTTPVLPAPAPPHAAMNLPLPGMVPFQRVLAVDPHTLISVVVGDFDGAFLNGEMPIDLARLQSHRRGPVRALSQGPAHDLRTGPTLRGYDVGAIRTRIKHSGKDDFQA